MKKNFALGMAFILSAAAVLPSISSAATFERQLQLGMRGSDVTALQTFLASDSTLYPQGLITGYFGSLTRAAVMRFQARNGISQVGRVGPQTLAALASLVDNGRKVGTDRVAPTISRVNVSTATTAVTITWNTDQAAAGLVYIDTAPIRMTEADEVNGVTISGASNIANINLTTSHSASIANLQSNTTYYYAIYVRDEFGNVSLTLPATFRTN